MIVAIHQPNFFPWLGFFKKLVTADRFIALDDVQFSRGSWGNRVKCLVAGKPHWVTAPLDRSSMSIGKLYKEVCFEGSSPWREQILRTLNGYYRKSPHWSEAMALLEPLIRNPDNMLAAYNLYAIRAIGEAIGINTSKMLSAASLRTAETGTMRLISLTKDLQGSVYLAGGGAAGYQEDELFAAAGVELRYQDFGHSVYSQAGGDEFVPGLSIIDALCNVGVDGTRVLLEG